MSNAAELGKLVVTFILWCTAGWLYWEWCKWVAKKEVERYQRSVVEEMDRAEQEWLDREEELHGPSEDDPLLHLVGEAAARQHPELVPEDENDKAFALDIENLQPEKPHFPTTPPRLAS